MPPNQEVSSKNRAEDRDFALQCWNLGLVDRPTISRLIAAIKARHYEVRLQDLMIQEGLISKQKAAELALLRTNSSAPITQRQAPPSTAALPQVPGFSMSKKLSCARGLEKYLVENSRGEQEVLYLLPRKITPASDAAKQLLKFWSQIRALNHSMIASSNWVGQFDHRFFLTREYLPGRTLEDLIQQRQIFPRPNALSLISALANVVEFAHERQIVHNDINPATVVFLANGQVKFQDFGLERKIIEIAGLAEPESLTCFRSPEDLREQRRGVANDLFSLGALLFFAVSGKPPPRAERTKNVVITDLTKIAPTLDAELSLLMTHLLLPRLNRIASIQHLRQALKETSDVKAIPDPVSQSARESMATIETGETGFDANPSLNLVSAEEQLGKETQTSRVDSVSVFEKTVVLDELPKAISEPVSQSAQESSATIETGETGFDANPSLNLVPSEEQLGKEAQTSRTDSVSVFAKTVVLDELPNAIPNQKDRAGALDTQRPSPKNSEIALTARPSLPEMTVDPGAATLIEGQTSPYFSRGPGAASSLQPAGPSDTSASRLGSDKRPSAAPILRSPAPSPANKASSSLTSRSRALQRQPDLCPGFKILSESSPITWQRFDAERRKDHTQVKLYLSNKLDPDAQQRCLKSLEALIKKPLQHWPAYLAVDTSTDERVFVAQEALEGQTLQSLDQYGKMEFLEGAHLLKQIVAALLECEKAGFAPSDLLSVKSILLTYHDGQDVIKIASGPHHEDFGDFQDRPLLSVTEQIYTVGIIAYQLFTGQQPIRGRRRKNLAELRDSWHPPEDLNQFCRKAIGRPSRSYQSLSELDSALKNIGTASAKPGVGPGNKLLIGLIVLSLLLIILSIAAIYLAIS